MTRLLLLIACLLFCATAERTNAQVHFEPASIQFVYTGCSLDTVVETTLINTADTAVIAPLLLGAGVSIFDAPEGWGSDAEDTINAHDSVRLLLQMSGAKRATRVITSVVFGSKDSAQFSSRADWNYDELIFTRAGTSFEKMQLGETRHDTILIYNPSKESRSIRVRRIISEGDWKLSGFADGFVLGPGLSTNLYISYTAVELSEHQPAELSAQIRDTCVGFDFSFNATIEKNLNVAIESRPVVRVLQHGHSLDIQGCQLGASITLTDLTGRTHYDAHAKETTHKIDLSELPHGVYLVRITTGSDTQTRKIVVGK